MKTKILLLVILFFSIKGYNQTWQWTHPETGVEDAPGHDIATDASGNVYVLGDYHDTLYLNNMIREKGSSGSFVAKYDSTGALLWYKVIKPYPHNGDYHYIGASGMVINAKGVFLTGIYGAGMADYACGTLTTNQVNYDYKIGSYKFTSAVGDIGVFICKLNFNGGVVWNELYRFPLCSEGNIKGYSGSTPFHPLISTDKNNNIISSFITSASPSLSLNGAAIPLHNPSSNNNGSQLVTVKLNSNGIVAWSNYAYNEADVNTGYIEDFNSSICDNSGNIFLFGTAGDQSQFGSIQFRTGFRNPTVIAKISASGTWQFVKELASLSFNTLRVSGNGNPNRLAIDDANNVYASVNIEMGDYTTKYIYGNPVVPTAGVPSMYIVKTTNSGNLIWYKNFGTVAANSPYNSGDVNSIFCSNNNLYLTGGLSVYTGVIDDFAVFSKLTVPVGNNNAGGGLDYFVAKADTSANFNWVSNFYGTSNTAGLSICNFGNNIYTCGYYRQAIISLGNLSNPVTFNRSADNLFFGKLKDQYIKVGAVTPTNTCPGGSITIPFTSYGLTFSGKNEFTAELSDANGDFTNPVNIGSVTSKGSGKITATIPLNLTYSNDYRVRIKSSDTLKTGYSYYTYADTVYKITLICPAPSSGFKATTVTATSAKLNWNIIDCGKAYKVQYRKKGTTKWTTVNTSGNVSSINISGLTAKTVYQWKVATKCKNQGVNTTSAYSAIQQFTTAAPVALQLLTDKLNTEDNGIKVYPNPATNTTTIEFNSITRGNYTLQVTDVAGRVLLTKELFASEGANMIELNVNSYAKGMYFINIITKQTKKVIELEKQ